MVKLYGIKVSDCSDENTFNILMKYISEERKERIKRFVFQKDSIRCLLGEIIARYAISKNLHYNNNEISFSVNSHNKPILDNADSVYFNISHSGNWVVCVLSEEPSGIDVELLKEIDFNIAKRFFTCDEYDDLLMQPDNYQTKYFYKLWTLKESYIKADGRGLSLPLDSFSIKIKGDNISLLTNNNLKDCFFKQFEIDSSYIVSVCSLDGSFPDRLEYISIEDIVNTLSV